MDDREQVERKVLDWCRFFLESGPDGRPVRNSSYPGQSNYKRDLFNIFAAAYRTGLCTGPGCVTDETIRDRAKAFGKITGEEPRGDAWGEILEFACEHWSEWTYALEQYGVD